VNAVTHRNYMENSCIQVAVYDDRVEITSPGMLYGDLDIDSIKKGKSKIRNKGIAEVFNRMKIIEEWGTGISRIISGCKEYGLPEPEFMEIGDSFRVNIFRKPEYISKKRPESRQESGQESNQENSNKTQIAILKLIRENNAITQEEMSARVGVSFGAIKKHFAS
jgi:ATP-dependent DNA helicase RecG